MIREYRTRSGPSCYMGDTTPAAESLDALYEFPITTTLQEPDSWIGNNTSHHYFMPSE